MYGLILLRSDERIKIIWWWNDYFRIRKELKKNIFIEGRMIWLWLKLVYV